MIGVVWVNLNLAPRDVGELSQELLGVESRIIAAYLPPLDAAILIQALLGHKLAQPEATCLSPLRKEPAQHRPGPALVGKPAMRWDLALKDHQLSRIL